MCFGGKTTGPRAVQLGGQEPTLVRNSVQTILTWHLSSVNQMVCFGFFPLLGVVRKAIIWSFFKYSFVVCLSLIRSIWGQ